MKELLDSGESPKKVEKKHETPEEAKERRTELVDRSFALKKHFEDKPIPHDPHLVARLMVAEHILAINEQLEEPEKAPKHISPEELTLALDYMGEVAEKLEDPSSDSSPEIQDAYEALLHLTKEALEETPANDIVQLVATAVATETTPRTEYEPPLAPDHTAVIRPQETNPEIEGANNTSRPTVTAVIQMLSSLRAHSHRPLQPPPSSSSTGPIKAPSDGGFRPISAMQRRPPSANLSPIPHQQRYESSPSPRQHTGYERARTIPSAAAPIAAVAISATLLHNRPDYPKPSETFRPLLPETPETPHFPTKNETRAESFSAPTQDFPPSPSNHPEVTPAPYERPHHEFVPGIRHDEPAPFHTPASEHEPAHSLPPKSSRKIEHYPLHTLLHMAESVPLGHGRYLREMFEKNEIDKEGLVKILKSRSKGKDFTQEFHRQYARFQHIKSSPEFLHHPSPVIKQAEDDDVTSPDPFFIQQPEPTTPQPQQPTVPARNLSTQPPSQAVTTSPSPKPRTIPTESSVPPFVWIVAILAALLVLVLILTFMF